MIRTVQCHRVSSRRGGTASKWPVDAAGPAAAVDGSSKSLSGGAAHNRLDASGAHSPLENRHTPAGFPQAPTGPSAGPHENGPEPLLKQTDRGR